MEKLVTIQKRENLNRVFANDEIGPGGANHEYMIKPADDDRKILSIQFQKKPRNSNDSIQGILDVDLLEIVRNRLQGFQNGDFSCCENAFALTHIEEALLWLNKRTDDRSYRNVLDTYQK